jgi:hypothetical protein
LPPDGLAVEMQDGNKERTAAPDDQQGDSGDEQLPKAG